MRHHLLHVYIYICIYTHTPRFETNSHEVSLRNASHLSRDERYVRNPTGHELGYANCGLGFWKFCLLVALKRPRKIVLKY